MSTEENMSVIKKIFDGLNQGNLGILDECLAENFVRHGVGFPDMDREGYKKLLTGMGISPGSDFRSTVDEMVVEGDKVAFRCTHRMTQMGKQITTAEFYFSRLKDDKVAEWWCLADMLGLYQQMGLLPPTEEIGK